MQTSNWGLTESEKSEIGQLEIERNLLTVKLLVAKVLNGSLLICELGSRKTGFSRPNFNDQSVVGTRQHEIIEFEN